jgi:hypothetical protein
MKAKRNVPSSSAGLAAWAAVSVVLPLLASSPASATHLFGNINGNPHTVAHINPPAEVTLDPEPVTELHVTSARILLALATQGLDADGADNNAATAGDNWTINAGALSANSLKVEFYRAFVDTEPNATCGSFTFNNNQTFHHTGGAALCLTYHPHAGDPVDIRWIQAVLTDAPGNRHAATPFLGRTLYLDNFHKPVGDPFYEPGAAANAGAFYDAPFRGIAGNIDWEADVFVATGNLATRTLTIYDGARWGFQITVPEPSSLAVFGASLIGFAALQLAAGVRRRRTHVAT